MISYLKPLTLELFNLSMGCKHMLHTEAFNGLLGIVACCWANVSAKLDFIPGKRQTRFSNRRSSPVEIYCNRIYYY